MNKKIVVIGGGSGSFVVLSGLKQFYDIDITSVVNMFDSGGSSGKLRDEHGVLPPGDIRRCLVALSAEGILRDLFEYRFPVEGSVSGHSFGNLFLTALKNILERKGIPNSDVEAIKTAAKLFPIKGQVLPVTADSAKLCARLQDGTIIEGETNIDVPKHDGNIAIDTVYLSPEAYILEDTRQAILEADVVVIGPGDLYTSLLPSFLVKGMKETIAESKARFVYICNVMTKWGETHGFSASRFVTEVLKYTGREKLDTVICNNSTIDKNVLAKYEQEKAYPVTIDSDLYLYAKQVIRNDVISQTDIIRHDSMKLAAILHDL